VNVIEVKNLIKKYKDLTAVNDISFEVKEGEIFGLLGENGAGKTTTLEMIEGLRRPTSGTIEILGNELHNGNNNTVKEQIGVQLQSSAYYNFLNLEEILDLFGSFYSKHQDPHKLLKMVDLEDKTKSLIGSLSGGQKQRFSIVASLVNNPKIVFLDEPTTGLDPVARRHLWDLISDIKSQGKTIILTTHYMEEAEILCDRIAIMDQGKIVAMGETHKLIEQTEKPFKMDFISHKISNSIIEKISKLGIVDKVLGKSGHYEAKFKNQSDLNVAIGLIQKEDPESFTVGRASLEDLFIELTGKRISEGENA
jgi:ABC-2 type transport system ATP-binding protein